MSAHLFSPPCLLFVFGGLAVGLFAASWMGPSSRVIGGGPDPPVFIWYLRWIPFAIMHGSNPLVTNYLDYPAGVNVMWQTSIPLLGLLLWPVTVSLGPIFAYNVMMTASVALSGWCAFLAFRRHVQRPVAAVVGGLLFAVSPYMLAQSLGHPHVGVAFICPLLLIAFEEAVIFQRRSPWALGLAVGGLAAAQLLISEELLLTQVLVAAAAGAILAGMYRSEVRPRLGYVARVMLPAGALFLLVGAVPLTVQFFGPQAVHGRLPASNVFVTDLAGFVLPTSLQAIAPPDLTALTGRFAGSQYEAGAYLGFPLIGLLWLGVRRWWHLPLVQAGSQLLLLAAALSLGVTIHVGGLATGIPGGLMALAFLPLMRTSAGRLMPALFGLAWIGMAVAPILNNIVPSRMTLYVFLFASLLVSVFLDQVLEMPRHAWRSLRGTTTVVLAALTLFSLAPRIPFTSSAVIVPTFFTLGSKATIADGSVVLVIPYAHNFESRAMVWQLASGLRFRMPEGYANRPGPALDPPASPLGRALILVQDGSAAPTVTEAYRSQVLLRLRASNVSAIVVGPMSGQDRMVGFVSAIVGQGPAVDGDVFVWHLPWS